MTAQLLQNRNSENLILFFNGWSLDAFPLQNLASTQFDVIAVHDYTNRILPQDISSILTNPSRNIFVIGFSMGVSVANEVLQPFNSVIKNAIAINGTLQPLHDEYGIPFKLFQQTLEAFTPQSQEKFYLRLCGNTESYKRFAESAPKRSFENKKTELEALLKYGNPQTSGLLYKHAIISLQDRIMAPQNQDRYWNNRVTIHHIEAPHFVFYKWKSWDEIIDYTCNDNK